MARSLWGDSKDWSADVALPSLQLEMASFSIPEQCKPRPLSVRTPPLSLVSMWQMAIWLHHGSGQPNHARSVPMVFLEAMVVIPTSYIRFLVQMLFMTLCDRGTVKIK